MKFIQIHSQFEKSECIISITSTWYVNQKFSFLSDQELKNLIFDQKLCFFLIFFVTHDIFTFSIKFPGWTTRKLCKILFFYRTIKKEKEFLGKTRNKSCVLVIFWYFEENLISANRGQEWFTLFQNPSIHPTIHNHIQVKAHFYFWAKVIFYVFLKFL
jgi:hypothetical protein